MNTYHAAENKIVKIVPGAWVASGQRLVLGIERVKRNLVAQVQKTLDLPQRLVQVALNEAEGLAWETEYPQLVFPSLAEEKIEALSKWYGGGEALRGAYAMAV